MKNRAIARAVWVMVIVSSVILTGTQLAATKADVQTPINVAWAQWVTQVSDTTGAITGWREIEAAPGDRNVPLRVSIQNIGNYTIMGITAYLALQYPFKNITSGDICNTGAYSYTGSIVPGGNLEANFLMSIDVRASPGEYRLKMTINYLEQATGIGKVLYFQKSTDVTVPVVVSSTRYMVIYETVASPSVTVPNGNITIAGNVLNVGKVAAYNTNITVTSPAFIRSTSIIVGEVDPNIPRPFSARFQARTNLAPGTYPITITAAYSDQYLIYHTSRFELRLTIRPPEPPRPPQPERTSTAIGMLIEILYDLLSAFLGLASIGPI